MKTMKNLNTLFFAITLLLFTACSSDDNQQEEGVELSEIVMLDFQEKLSQMDTPSSLKNSSDPYALQASSQFLLVKGFAKSFSELFTVPTDAISNKSSIKKSSSNSSKNKGGSNGSQTYTWSIDGTTITYTIADTPDRYTFKYTIAFNGSLYTFMSGYELKDGSYAELKMFDTNNTTIFSMKWWVQSEYAKFEMNTVDSKFLVESNISDNSGNIKLYDQTSLIQEYNWNTDGSGWFKDYLTNETFTW